VIGMPIGRPRDFDLDKALDQALAVFWHKGYEGASLAELTKAMGINRPSLYAAFGNKEALFRKALDRYAAGPAAYVQAALAEPTARGVAQRLLKGTIDVLADPRNPPGCLWVQGALACGEPAEPIRRELAERRAQGQAAIQRRFKRAIAEGDLPAGTDAAALARFIATINLGMAVQAAGGATRAQLRRIAEMAMRAWPV
jgi:AcrR family transcriptional regulator